MARLLFPRRKEGRETLRYIYLENFNNRKGGEQTHVDQTTAMVLPLCCMMAVSAGRGQGFLDHHDYINLNKLCLPAKQFSVFYFGQKNYQLLEIITKC